MANTKNKECMAYKNKLEYSKKYAKENCVKKNILFNTKIELDIKMLDYLDSKGNRNAFVKGLIFDQMKKDGIISQNK